jgi:phosphoribosylaminoimidazole (AIR) synthetase
MAEMFRVFNMGVGMVVITPESQLDEALRSLESSGHRAGRIGTVTSEANVVRIPQHGLAGGHNDEGNSAFRPM